MAKPKKKPESTPLNMVSPKPAREYPEKEQERFMLPNRWGKTEFECSKCGVNWNMFDMYVEATYYDRFITYNAYCPDPTCNRICFTQHYNILVQDGARVLDRKLNPEIDCPADCSHKEPGCNLVNGCGFRNKKKKAAPAKPAVTFILHDYCDTCRYTYPSTACATCRQNPFPWLRGTVNEWWKRRVAKKYPAPCPYCKSANGFQYLDGIDDADEEVKPFSQRCLQCNLILDVDLRGIEVEKLLPKGKRVKPVCKAPKIITLESFIK